MIGFPGASAMSMDKIETFRNKAYTAEPMGVQDPFNHSRIETVNRDLSHVSKGPIVAPLIERVAVSEHYARFSIERFR